MPVTVIEARQLEKRHLILQAARHCFIQHGFHSTGMAEVCQAAGMSPGNLYRYFSSKSAIILAIVEETRKQMMPIYEELQDHADPVEGIVKIILCCVEHLSDAGESRLWIEILAEASRNKGIRQSCQSFDGQMQVILRKLIRRGIKSRQISSKIDSEALLMWLVALVDDTILRSATHSLSDADWTPKTLTRRVRHLLHSRPA